MRKGPENCRRVLQAQWCVLHLELGLRNGGDSMASIVCVQGQAEVSREPHVLIPILEGIPQDVQDSFGVQESQGDLQDLCLIPEVEQSTQLYSGEMREFLPSSLGDLIWSSVERSLSGRLVQSLVSGFAI